MGGRVRNKRETDLGTELQCSVCKEFWPADAEFFSPKGAFWHSACKACRAETVQVTRAIDRAAARSQQCA